MDLKSVGRYNIVGRIGRGAMGEVYRAFDPVLNRSVAIKMLTAQFGLDAEMRKRFEREAQSAARLTHPNIVTVYELGEEGGSIFIAMELLEGRDLKDLIGLPELRDLGERLRIMDQVLAGVAYAHERGVVHRDLKPANIRVLPNGQIKVLDFGLARMATGAEMTQAGTLMGTPNYMSPEQVRGEKADAASDVFALGAVFYELLAGKRAFHTETIHTTLAKVLTEDPEPLAKVAPEAPVPIREVVEHALAKEHAQRYANAGYMRAALQAVAPSLAGARGGQRRRASDDSVAVPGMRGSARGTSGASAAPTLLGLPEARTQAELDPAVLDERDSTTYVPDQTAVPPGETVYGAPPGVSRAAIFAGLGVLALGVAGSSWFLIERARRPEPAAARPEVTAAQQEGALTATLVEVILQGARLDLQNKQYEGARQGAEDALKEDPASAEAQKIRQQAQDAIEARAAAARQAEQALARKDMDAASQALSRLLEIDPRHPSVPQLTAALNATFQRRAEEAKAAALAARGQAAAAAGEKGYGEADAQLKQADALIARGEFAAATGKFAEARDAFGRAQRAALQEQAERQRQAEAQRLAQQRAARQAEAARAAEAARTQPPVAPPVVTAPAVTAPPVAVATVNPQEPAIRQLLAEYERAMEARDLGLLRTVWPGLAGGEQKRFEEIFKRVKTWDVGLRVDGIEINGAQAVVRAARQDVIGGMRTDPAKQVFRIAQRVDGWKIESIGQ